MVLRQSRESILVLRRGPRATNKEKELLVFPPRVSPGCALDVVSVDQKLIVSARTGIIGARHPQARQQKRQPDAQLCSDIFESACTDVCLANGPAEAKHLRPVCKTCLLLCTQAHTPLLQSAVARSLPSGDAAVDMRTMRKISTGMKSSMESPWWAKPRLRAHGAQKPRPY